MKQRERAVHVCTHGARRQSVVSSCRSPLGYCLALALDRNMHSALRFTPPRPRLDSSRWPRQCLKRNFNREPLSISTNVGTLTQTVTRSMLEAAFVGKRERFSRDEPMSFACVSIPLKITSKLASSRSASSFWPGDTPGRAGFESMTRGSCRNAQTQTAQNFMLKRHLQKPHESSLHRERLTYSIGDEIFLHHLQAKVASSCCTSLIETPQHTHTRARINTLLSVAGKLCGRCQRKHRAHKLNLKFPHQPSQQQQHPQSTSNEKHAKKRKRHSKHNRLPKRRPPLPLLLKGKLRRLPQSKRKKAIRANPNRAMNSSLEL